MLTRIEAEDIFHDAISMILSPGIPPSDIRPAFQKVWQPNPAGQNYLGETSAEDGIKPFTNIDRFCYFLVRLGQSNDQESEIINQEATTIRNIDLTVYCYGKDSSSSALLLKGLMRSSPVQMYLNNLGIYQLEEGSITPIDEEINGQWWERNDVTFNFSIKERFDLTRDLSVIEKLGTFETNIVLDGKFIKGK